MLCFSYRRLKYQTLVENLKYSLAADNGKNNKYTHHKELGRIEIRRKKIDSPMPHSLYLESILHRRLYLMTDNAVRTNFAHSFHPLECSASTENNGRNNCIVVVIGFLNLYERRHERQNESKRERERREKTRLSKKNAE